MIDSGCVQKNLFDNIHRIDCRLDKSLLNKIINDVCLPILKVLNSICDYLKCDVLDIYDKSEINLLHDTNKINKNNKKDKSHNKNIYNLTVEIPRDLADRIFNKQTLQKLGFLNKSDCIRSFINSLEKKLRKIQEKEKAVLNNDTIQNSSSICQ